jgi:cbb3-type cytochrome oxidase maturation protein
MEVIYTMIPGMMFFGLIFVAILIWAVKKGQYEDMEGNASRILLDDDEDAMLRDDAPKPKVKKVGEPPAP